MSQRAGVALLLACIAAAAEPQWDWLPAATWRGEACDAALRADGDWTATPDTGTATVQRADGALRIHLEGAPGTVALRHAEAVITLRLLAPGAGAELVAADGRLRLGADPVLLAPARREIAEDRRWAAFRQRDASAIRCAALIEAPAAAWGVPALPGLIAAAQRIEVRGQGVLLRLPDADRLAGWNRREYRMCVAWLVADIAARGGTPVLVAPCAPDLEADAIAGLRTEVREVAAAWSVRLVEPALSAAANWSDAQGQAQAVLGAAGEAAWRAAVADWLPGG